MSLTANHCITLTGAHTCCVESGRPQASNLVIEPAISAVTRAIQAGRCMDPVVIWIQTNQWSIILTHAAIMKAHVIISAVGVIFSDRVNFVAYYQILLRFCFKIRIETDLRYFSRCNIPILEGIFWHLSIDFLIFLLVFTIISQFLFKNGARRGHTERDGRDWRLASKILARWWWVSLAHINSTFVCYNFIRVIRQIVPLLFFNWLRWALIELKTCLMLFNLFSPATSQWNITLLILSLTSKICVVHIITVLCVLTEHILCANQG